ncbi:MAG: hypothetical protein JSU90_03215 [Nitrospiraceae bacterium]|nr:MAG: hypothetical protein JSU90_03215 [Nitrospiraceae bacterium]
MTVCRMVLSFLLLFLATTAGCATAQEKPPVSSPSVHNIAIPPLLLAGPDDAKLWEGDVEGRAVSYFRSHREGGTSDVIVVTEDSLPAYFRRIEYLDKGGDGELDLVRMRIYEKDKGWRNVGITKENKYGLAYAESQYRELMGKVRVASELQHR